MSENNGRNRNVRRKQGANVRRSTSWDRNKTVVIRIGIIIAVMVLAIMYSGYYRVWKINGKSQQGRYS